MKAPQNQLTPKYKDNVEALHIRPATKAPPSTSWAADGSRLTASQSFFSLLRKAECGNAFVRDRIRVDGWEEGSAVPDGELMEQH